MKFAKAEPEDVKGIMRIYLLDNEERVNAGLRKPQWKDILDEEGWLKLLEDGEHRTYVAKEREYVLGLISIQRIPFVPNVHEGIPGEVNILFVDQRFRRKGIGKGLYEVAKKGFRSLKVQQTIVNVRVGAARDSPGYLFWTGMGFRTVSETEYKRGDGSIEKTAYMDYVPPRKTINIDIGKYVDAIKAPFIQIHNGLEALIYDFQQGCLRLLRRLRQAPKNFIVWVKARLARRKKDVQMPVQTPQDAPAKPQNPV